MRIFKTSLALLALFALMLPCAHADEHHEHEAVAAEVCAEDHAECHTCTDTPCTELTQIVPANPVSSLEVPIRQIQLLTVFGTDRPMFVAAARPPGELLLLQTVQLLI